jgi:peptidoglycan hydrolase CwlO-like protein
VTLIITLVVLGGLLISSSEGQNTHANVSLQQAQDRVATAEMNLQNVKQGISERNAFLTQKEFDVKKKDEQIQNLEKKSGNLFQAKIDQLNEEIRAGKSEIDKGRQGVYDLLQEEKK